MLSIYHCLALCEEESGCVAVTIQPATSRCWLKNKEGGAYTVAMDGVRSANLKSTTLCRHFEIQILKFRFRYLQAPTLMTMTFLSIMMNDDAH